MKRLTLLLLTALTACVAVPVHASEPPVAPIVSDGSAVAVAAHASVVVAPFVRSISLPGAQWFHDSLATESRIAERTVRAAPPRTLLPILADSPIDSTGTATTSPKPINRQALLLSLVGIAVMGITANTSASDKDSKFALDSVRVQHNFLVADLLYAKRNYIVGTTTPACATGSGNVKPKTTAAVNYVRGGVPRAQLAASDNFWDLTTAAQGVGVVPIASTIKYWLCVTAAEAMKVYSSAIVASGTVPAFPAAPADGDVILGVLTVTTVGATYTPGTTSLAGISSYVDGSDGSEIMSSQLKA